jgi:predicted O-methyltransferase YrrM
MVSYDYKLKNFLETELEKIKKPNIIEFGVKEGRSTKIFLDYCERNDGKLYSVDIDDYSSLFKNQKWKFIQSRDDNFELIDGHIDRRFDLIYLDSLHEANHVEKIFYHYYDKLVINGFFFIDDTSWLPYLRNAQRDNFYCEINNKETFQKILSIYNMNTENFDLEFSFISSGLCKIKKKKDTLNSIKEINTREISLKNFIRKIKKKLNEIL